MDKTHLRFFALNGIKDMFKGAGFEIDKIEHKISASKVKKFLNKLFPGFLLNAITEQYIVVARRAR